MVKKCSYDQAIKIARMKINDGEADRPSVGASVNGGLVITFTVVVSDDECAEDEKEAL